MAQDVKFVKKFGHFRYYTKIIMDIVAVDCFKRQEQFTTQFFYTCKLAQLHETFNIFFIEKIIWIKFVVAFCLVLLVSEFSCYLILHRYIYQHNKEMEQNSIITENTFKNRLYKIYKLRNI